MRTLLVLLLVSTATGAAWAVPRVVVTIAPVHAIVADVMAGVGEPALLLPADRSPHHYSLKPSDARLLADAGLLFLVGPELETFLVKPLASLVADARVVQLGARQELLRLPMRDHHGDDQPAGPRATDPHLWLATGNAARIAELAAAELTAIDPHNAARYRDNADAAAARYRELGEDIRARLAAVAGRAYIAFHDAFQYFEQEVGLRFAGALRETPERSPGVAHVRELRRAVESGDVFCIFIEPQFPESLVRAVTGDNKVPVVAVDPLGAGIASGPGAYTAMFDAFADAVAGCLANGDEP